MGKSKAHMPKHLEKKCHVAIHSATVAAGAAGAIPIPMSDAVPITAAQIGMVVALGKIFDVTLSESAAKSIVATGAARGAGRVLVANLIKMVPGAGTAIGGTISAATAVAITEALGWIIADDFYRMSQGKEPQNIVETAGDLKGAFEGLRFSKKR